MTALQAKVQAKQGHLHEVYSQLTSRGVVHSEAELKGVRSQHNFPRFDRWNTQHGGFGQWDWAQGTLLTLGKSA